MSKFIGVKMIEAVPMTAREANDKGFGTATSATHSSLYSP